MSGDSRENCSDPPLEWVEDRLRSLGRISPPASLRSKLAGGIPQGADRGVETSIGRRRLRWLSYVGAAAAVVGLHAASASKLATIITWIFVWFFIIHTPCLSRFAVILLDRYELYVKIVC